MMQADSPNPYAVNSLDTPAAFAVDAERATFIRRTYAHLTGAILGLIALETAIFQLVPVQTIESIVAPMRGWGWLVVLGVFMLVSTIANKWALSSGQSRGLQYAGLSLYTVAWAVMLLPLLHICINWLGDPQLPVMAAVITAMAFIGLTGFVFITGADFSGIGKYLNLACIIALGVIVAGLLFGFSPGLWFSVPMVALMCGYILYDTSNVMHHYNTNQYVAASLALFASVVTLFWYVLQIMMSMAGED